MVANINNFGVINFYENNASKQEPAQKAEPVCEDITPAEDSSSASDCQSDTPSSPASDKCPKDILPIPQQNKYTQVREYIIERCRFDEEFKEYVDSHSRVDLCQRLSKEFGWFVDDHKLGVNINRHR